jgi:hypothetical protein
MTTPFWHHTRPQMDATEGTPDIKDFPNRPYDGCKPTHGYKRSYHRYILIRLEEDLSDRTSH